MRCGNRGNNSDRGDKPGGSEFAFHHSPPSFERHQRRTARKMRQSYPRMHGSGYPKPAIPIRKAQKS
jgi:hypothetical protein